jgi:hypothetical protein
VRTSNPMNCNLHFHHSESLKSHVTVYYYSVNAILV